MQLGMSLSGGGVRAAGFHLGVLARLAEEGALEDITFLSTVSGGSLAVGLVYALNDFMWPSSARYLRKTLPDACRMMTSRCLQSRLVIRVMRQSVVHPTRLLGTRADDLSLLLRKHWGVTAQLRDLPSHPRWVVNATCYETGKNWRFERHRMGDYAFGYTADPRIPLSDAMAASAGFPGLIGPLVLDASAFDWYVYDHQASPRVPAGADARDRPAKRPLARPAFRRVHLWDGGVYDNLGIEALCKYGRGWREGVNFVIASDASAHSEAALYRPTRAFLRLTTGILMDQVRSLRSRAFVERIADPSSGSRGALIRIGNTPEEILRNAGKGDLARTLGPGFLRCEDARAAAAVKTHIARLTTADFELLSRHGFEVADSTLHGYNPDLFGTCSRHCSSSRWHGAPHGWRHD